MNDKQKLLALCLGIVLLKSMLYIYMYTELCVWIEKEW